jgi:hypothetical protein
MGSERYVILVPYIKGKIHSMPMLDKTQKPGAGDIDHNSEWILSHGTQADLPPFHSHSIVTQMTTLLPLA